MNKVITILVLLLSSGYGEVAFLTGLAFSPINRFAIRDIPDQNSLIGSAHLGVQFNKVMVTAEFGYGSCTYFDSVTSFGGGPGVSYETHLNARVRQIPVTLSAMYFKKILDSQIVLGLGPEMGINVVKEEYRRITETHYSSTPFWGRPQKNINTIDNGTVIPVLYGVNASVRFNFGKIVSSFVSIGYRYSQVGLKAFKDTVDNTFNYRSEFTYASPVVKCGISFKIASVYK